MEKWSQGSVTHLVGEPLQGAALVTVSVIGIIVVAADDVTGIGVADDFLLGPLGAGIGEGLALILG